MRDERGDVYLYFAGAGSMPEYMFHPIAALALYGQPFGFTREDVVQIRRLLKYIKGEPGSYAGGTGFWESLADRIESLLPPETI